MRDLVIPEMLRLPLLLQTYFLQIRPSHACMAADGVFLGARPTALPHLHRDWAHPCPHLRLHL
jgi:hypothetical protein